MLQILLLAGLIMLTQGNRLFWVLAWPGTVLHEFAHYITGLVLLAQPSNFSVMPKPPGEDGSQELGSVEFENLGWWNKLPIAVAPLAIFPICLFWANDLAFSWNAVTVFKAWILASGIAMCLPSRQDWRSEEHTSELQSH